MRWPLLSRQTRWRKTACGFFSLVGNTVGSAGAGGWWLTWAVGKPETETLGTECFLKNYKLSFRASGWYGKNDSLRGAILPTRLEYSSSSPVVFSCGCVQSFQINCVWRLVVFPCHQSIISDQDSGALIWAAVVSFWLLWTNGSQAV